MGVQMAVLVLLYTVAWWHGVLTSVIAVAAALAFVQFLASWEPAADVMALATAEFELKDIEMGETDDRRDRQRN